MKRKTIKIIALVLTMICIISTCSVFASAADFKYNNWQYTEVTNTVGKSIAHYTGIASGSSSDYLNLYSYTQGGAIGNFETDMFMFVSNGSGAYFEHELNSDDLQNRTLQASIHKTVAEFPYSANGYVEHTCVSKTNYSDEWRINYLQVWAGGTTGWREY